MAKFPEADTRLFKNIFVCRRCKNKIRASNMRILSGKVKCRTCDGKALRPIKKK